jgi:hypothetical protein
MELMVADPRLLQPVDQQRAIRIELFRALGGSLARTSKLTHETGDLDVREAVQLIEAHPFQAKRHALAIERDQSMIADRDR